MKKITTLLIVILNINYFLAQTNTSFTKLKNSKKQFYIPLYGINLK